MMVKRRLKSFVVPMIYIFALGIFSGCLYLFQSVFNSNYNEYGEMIFVDSEIVTDNEYTPVINYSPTIMRPYLNDSVYLSRNFYDKDDTAENQEKAIIFYEGTYMQNSGVDYKFTDSFDIISILDGKVIDVSTNGGGDTFSLAEILGLMTNDDITLESYNIRSGHVSSETFKVDANYDGNFDDNDAYDYNYFVLSSGYSFSCANEFVNYCKKHNLAKIIGQKSGGGAFSISPAVTPFGSFFC